MSDWQTKSLKCNDVSNQLVQPYVIYHASYSMYIHYTPYLPYTFTNDMERCLIIPTSSKRAEWVLNDIQYPIYHRHPAKLVWLFCSVQTHFSKDDKNIEKNTETFLVFLFLRWQCCDLIMTISYQCLKFITAEFHLMNFLCYIEHWMKPINFAWVLPWKLTEERFTGSSNSSVIDRIWKGAVSSGGENLGSELHQVKMGGLKNFCLVTQSGTRIKVRGLRSKL